METTNEQVRLAAERVAGSTFFCTGEVWCQANAYWTGRPADAMSVAKAYLAEHPADEDEPLDSVWLQSIGFEIPDVAGWLGSITVNKYRELNIYSDHKCDIEIEHENGFCFLNLPEQRTRGDVRRLCAALGIELKGG